MQVRQRLSFPSAFSTQLSPVFIEEMVWNPAGYIYNICIKRPKVCVSDCIESDTLDDEGEAHSGWKRDYPYGHKMRYMITVIIFVWKRTGIASGVKEYTI